MLKQNKKIVDALRGLGPRDSIPVRSSEHQQLIEIRTRFVHTIENFYECMVSVELLDFRNFDPTLIFQ